MRWVISIPTLMLSSNSCYANDLSRRTRILHLGTISIHIKMNIICMGLGVLFSPSISILSIYRTAPHSRSWWMYYMLDRLAQTRPLCSVLLRGRTQLRNQQWHLSCKTMRVRRISRLQMSLPPLPKWRRRNLRISKVIRLGPRMHMPVNLGQQPRWSHAEWRATGKRLREMQRSLGR